MITQAQEHYAKGYRDGVLDEQKRMTIALWEEVSLLKIAYPELAEGIKLAIDIIEKRN